MTILGYHLLLQGVGIRRQEGDIGLFLLQAIEQTGLRAACEPYIDATRGFVVIAESHISVHIEGANAAIDVFSCQTFPWPAMKRIAFSVFSGHWNHNLIRRDGPDA